MPHINIKLFPRDLNDKQKESLALGISEVVKTVLDCDEDHISIAIETVPPDEWDELVYDPEIKIKSRLLIKTPNY